MKASHESQVNGVLGEVHYTLGPVDPLVSSLGRNRFDIDLTMACPMPPSDDINELRDALRSLQSGLLTALESLEIMMKTSQHPDACEEHVARLKATVRSLQSLQPPDNERGSDQRSADDNNKRCNPPPGES